MAKGPKQLARTASNLGPFDPECPGRDLRGPGFSCFCPGVRAMDDRRSVGGPSRLGSPHFPGGSTPEQLAPIERRWKASCFQGETSMKALTLCALLFPLAALADGPFDGTWVQKDDATQFDQKPYVISLSKGVWHSEAAVPPVKVKADGTDQPVTGHAYYDTVAAKAVNNETVQVTNKKAGKVTGTNTFTASADGKTLTQKYNDTSGTEPATGEVVFTRVGKAAADSHAVSGSWRATKIQNQNTASSTMTIKASADGLNVKYANGLSYDAKFDGKDYPVSSDPGGTMVSLKKNGANTIVETDKRAGKVVEVDTMTVSADGKTMKIDSDNHLQHRKGSAVMEK